jgi:hypothetical protein
LFLPLYGVIYRSGRAELDVVFRATRRDWVVIGLPPEREQTHNLAHAAGGMTMHLAYYGVTEPFAAGRDTGTHPE